MTSRCAHSNLPLVLRLFAIHLAAALLGVFMICGESCLFCLPFELQFCPCIFCPASVQIIRHDEHTATSYNVDIVEMTVYASPSHGVQQKNWLSTVSHSKFSSRLVTLRSSCRCPPYHHVVSLKFLDSLA